MNGSLLVTGGAGFIGSNFIRYFIRNERNVRIVNLDALTYAGSLENIVDISDPGRHTFVRGNICDRSAVDSLLREYSIDAIVHFAAETHVDRSIANSESFIRTNVLGTGTLLEAARAYWMGKSARPRRPVCFFHISTDEVFGSLAPDDPPFNEASPYRPSSPYAASKAAGDHLVRAYFHTYGLPAIILHCSNTYGPYQFPEKMIALAVVNGLRGKRLPLYGDGRQIRDWIYIDDSCEAVRRVIAGGRPGETYIVGGGTQPTNLEVVKMICTILDERFPDSKYFPHESLIRFVEDRPGHDRRYAADGSKIRRNLGWAPREALETGLRKTVDWYSAHPEWISAVVNGPEYRKWMDSNYGERGEWR